MALTILSVAFLALLILGVPVAFSIGLAAVSTILYEGLPVAVVFQRMAAGMNVFSFLAIPFFIFAGELMLHGGIADRIVAFAKNLVGHIRGGLGMANVVSCTLFGGVSGSPVADVSAMGAVMIPMMKKEGYDADYAVNVTTHAALVGALMPTSHNMIIYSISAGGKISIADLFTAGIIPGLLFAAALMVTAYFVARSRGYPTEAFPGFARVGQFFVWSLPGLLLIEMKSTGRNLGIAELQALDYVNALTDTEQPRYILTSDFKRFRLLDMLAPKGADTVEFTLDELPKHTESLAFLAGYQTRSFGSGEQEAASIKAARIMADLYEALEGSGYDDHEASIFLVRVLFALYADDSGIWERDLFTEFIELRTSTDGSDLGAQLTMLFQVMNQPKERRASTLDELLARFPYVNGRVFAEPLSIPSFDRVMRDKLVSACAFNWASISPAIFGSLFQAVKSPEARRELGEHYTTETNIRKTIDPLFFDELTEKFEAAQHDTKALKKLRGELAELRRAIDEQRAAAPNEQTEK